MSTLERVSMSKGLLAKGKMVVLFLGCSTRIGALVPTYSLVQWESQSLVVRGTAVGWFVLEVPIVHTK